MCYGKKMIHVRKNRSGTISGKSLFSFIFIAASILMIGSDSILGLLAYRTSARWTEQYLSELSTRVFDLTEDLFATAQNTAEYLNYSSLIRNFMNCEDDQELISLYKSVEEFLNTMTLVENDIDSIILYRTNHRVLVYSKTAPTAKERNLWENWRLLLEGDRNPNGFIYLNDHHDSDSYIGYVTNVISVDKEKHYGETIGRILVVINPEILNNFLSIPVIDRTSSVSVSDAYGHVVFSSLASSSEESESLHPSYAPTDSHAFRRNILKSGWSIACMLQFDQQRSSQLRSFASGAIILAISLALLFFVYSFTLNKLFIHPIDNISQDIQLMNKSLIPYPIKTASRVREINEITLAINTLNDMQDKAKQDLLQAQQRMFDVELAKKANDLYLLENQVNPHFMRNTLQCISGLALTYDVPMINDIVDGLTEIYEYSLHEHGVVKLRDEIRIVEEYIKIVNIRYNDRYAFHISVPSELSNFFIPKMTLQPIVENAIYHGLRNKGTTVTIHAYIENSLLIISVADDGKGMQPQQLDELRSKLNNPVEREAATANRQVGLVNIYRRMLLYSEQCSMVVQSTESDGTTIILAFPLIADET